MIKSCTDKDMKAQFQGKRVRRSQAFRAQAERRLQILDSAKTIQDLMALPSNQFEALHGDREGQWSIRINQQWRVCFVWRDAEAYHVEIADYH